MSHILAQREDHEDKTGATCYSAGMGIAGQWLQAIVECASDAVIILDKERIIRYANPAALRMAARSGMQGSIIGISYDRIIGASRIYDEDGTVPDPKALPTHLALEEGIETRGKVLEQVYGGVHYWLQVTCVPIFDEKGNPAYAAVYFTDISNRKLREDKLKFLIESSKILSIAAETNERLIEKARLAVPTLADWCTINIVTPDGKLSRIAIVHRDPAKQPLVERLANLSEKDLERSMGIYAVLRAKKAQFNAVVTPEGLRRGGALSELTALAEKLQLCSSMIVPISSRGEVVGILSLAYAESGRHYTEEDLLFMQDFCHHLGILIGNTQLYEEIKKRDEAKDAFLAALSHELRNPLAPIKSFLELLKLKSGEENAKEFGVVERQFDHLTKLINSLLDISRFTLGKIEIEPARIHVQELVEQIAQSNRPFMASKQIAFSVSMAKEPLYVRADATRLEQAVTNILHNAEKFTPEGGRIALDVKNQDGRVHIRIRDSGPGLSSEDREAIAGGFMSAGRRSEKSGLGIGLTLVREIMRLHGGSMEAKSEGAGRGSEFTMTLPVEED